MWEGEGELLCDECESLGHICPECLEELWKEGE